MTASLLTAPLWPRVRPALSALLPLLASALLLALYARGGPAWPLGFVALLPWLHQLDTCQRLRGVLLSAWGFSVVLTAAAFSWLGLALGSYTQIGPGAGLALLLLAAPLFQPQVWLFALVRHAVQRAHGRAAGACAGAAAWVGAEWLLPRLLDDTLGYGLYPSVLLRQAADLGGTAGLTLLLLLTQEALVAAWARRSAGPAAWALPVAGAAAVPALLAAYGAVALAAQPDPAAPGAPLLRVALVQSNLADYERLRREQGAAAVVQQVLDTHFAMSYDAVERQHADAVLWSETVYPTTFGRPKSAAGAEFDQAILAFTQAAGVPFVFGTYDRDEQGEYNAAAFLAPGRGLLGHYRKARPFPFTEALPAVLDRPWLRDRLPWAGRWKAGDGARVFPLRLANGREVPVQPLICLDALDTRLALDGARLGSQALLTVSNDSWFSADPLGPTLHLAAAAFRSIETRRPQFRVATTGLSAIIDTAGTVRAGSRLGERTLVVGALPVGEVAPTLLVRWGDWVGPSALAGLGLLAAAHLARTLRRRTAPHTETPMTPAALPCRAALLPPAVRWGAGLLRAGARLGLLGLLGAIVFGEGSLQSNTLAQLRTVAAVFVLPEGLAWLLLWAYRAEVTLTPGPAATLNFRQGRRHLAVPLAGLQAARPWRLPLPGPGLSLTGLPGRPGLALARPWALAHALREAGAPLAAPAEPGPLGRSLRSRELVAAGGLAHPALRYGLFPLLLALPAFRLHQHIAYGSGLGEYIAFGASAYLTSLALWWGAWALGVLLCAAALRTVIEAALLLGSALRPAATDRLRRRLESAGLALLYLGLPAWLLARLLAG